jgi:hypothetical protein
MANVWRILRGLKKFGSPVIKTLEKGEMEMGETERLFKRKNSRVSARALLLLAQQLTSVNSGSLGHRNVSIDPPNHRQCDSMPCLAFEALWGRQKLRKILSKRTTFAASLFNFTNQTLLTIK